MVQLSREEVRSPDQLGVQPATVELEDECTPGRNRFTECGRGLLGFTSAIVFWTEGSHFHLPSRTPSPPSHRKLKRYNSQPDTMQNVLGLRTDGGDRDNIRRRHMATSDRKATSKTRGRLEVMKARTKIDSNTYNPLPVCTVSLSYYF